MFAMVLVLALAAGPSEETPEREQTEEVAMMFASCAGVWDWLALVEAEKPATAEQMRNIGNGAEITAMWLLATQHSLEGGTPTTYGQWGALTAPKRESTTTRFTALVEQGRRQAVLAEGEVCRELLTEQEKILQGMRRDRALQAD